MQSATSVSGNSRVLNFGDMLRFRLVNCLVRERRRNAIEVSRAGIEARDPTGLTFICFSATLPSPLDLGPQLVDHSGVGGGGRLNRVGRNYHTVIVYTALSRSHTFTDTLRALSVGTQSLSHCPCARSDSVTQTQTVTHHGDCDTVCLSLSRSARRTQSRGRSIFFVIPKSLWYSLVSL